MKLRFSNRFERDCNAVAAEYTLNDDGTVDVRISCHESGGLFVVPQR